MPSDGDSRAINVEVREIETLGGGVLCEVFLRDVEVPALADFMAGALAAIAVLAGLPAENSQPLTARGLDQLARSLEQAERLDPYYRAYACREGGFVAVACLNAPQRRAVCALFGVCRRSRSVSPS